MCALRVVHLAVAKGFVASATWKVMGRVSPPSVFIVAFFSPRDPGHGLIALPSANVGELCRTGVYVNLPNLCAAGLADGIPLYCHDVVDGVKCLPVRHVVAGAELLLACPFIRDLGYLLP